MCVQEPRCPDSQNGVGCPGPVTDFYRDLSAALKYLAPNHLVWFHTGSASELLVLVLPAQQDITIWRGHLNAIARSVQLRCGLRGMQQH